MPLSEPRLDRCCFVLLLPSQCQHRWRACCQFRGDLALGIDQHRHRGAASTEEPAHPHAVPIEQHRRTQPHRLVGLNTVGRDDQQPGRFLRWLRLPGLEVSEHALAKAATGSPKEHQGLVASEVGEADRLARQIGQAEVRGRLTHHGASRWSLVIGSPIALGSNHGQGRQPCWGKRRGDEGADGISPLSQGAANGAVAANEDGTGRSIDLVGLGDFAVVLQQHMRQPIFRHLRTIWPLPSPG